jgi:hypothetical protein
MMQDPQLIATDELIDTSTKDGNTPGPTRMELLQAEVREYNRLTKAQQEQKRAKRKRAKAGRRNNRKKK